MRSPPCTSASHGPQNRADSAELKLAIMADVQRFQWRRDFEPRQPPQNTPFVFCYLPLNSPRVPEVSRISLGCDTLPDCLLSSIAAT
jgi:hypothetical protein